jgi:hypothetical protein
MFLFSKLPRTLSVNIAQDNDEPVQWCTSQLNIETGSYVQLSKTPAATHTACPPRNPLRLSPCGLPFGISRFRAL